VRYISAYFTCTCTLPYLMGLLASNLNRLNRRQHSRCKILLVLLWL